MYKQKYSQLSPRLNTDSQSNTCSKSKNHNISQLREDIKIKRNLMLIFLTLRDAVLINHVIAEYQVSSVIDCAHRCMRKSRCVSFNFEDYSTSPRHVCQINDEKKQNNFKNFVGLDGFSYYEFEVSHRGVKIRTPFKYVTLRRGQTNCAL